MHSSSCRARATLASPCLPPRCRRVKPSTMWPRRMHTPASPRARSMATAAARARPRHSTLRRPQAKSRWRRAGQSSRAVVAVSSGAAPSPVRPPPPAPPARPPLPLALSSRRRAVLEGRRHSRCERRRCRWSLAPGRQRERENEKSTPSGTGRPESSRRPKEIWMPRRLRFGSEEAMRRRRLQRRRGAHGGQHRHRAQRPAWVFLRRSWI